MDQVEKRDDKSLTVLLACDMDRVDKRLSKALKGFMGLTQIVQSL